MERLPATVRGWPLLLGELFRRNDLHQVVDDDEADNEADDGQRLTEVSIDPDVDQAAQEPEADAGHHAQDAEDSLHDETQPRVRLGFGIEMIVLVTLNDAERGLRIHGEVLIGRHGFLPPW